MAKILLIDDVAGVRASIRMILKRAGHDVEEADGGRSGINKARADRFDIVITDILMPEQDGIETIRQLRELPHRPRIIAVSGGGTLVGTDDALTFARDLADACLEKPFDSATLLRAIDGNG